MACAASALFHCSAAPYVYREVRLRYCWAWDWNGPHHVDNSIMVTMAPAAPNPYEDSFLLSEYPYALPMHVTPKRDIAAGEKITRDMLTVEPIYPNGSDWIVEPGAAVGKYANETLPAGYSIRAAQLSDRTPLASGAPQAPPQQAAAAWYGPSRPAGVGAAQAAFDQQLAGTVSDPASPEVPSPIDESPTDDSQPPQANPYAVSAADSQASGDPPLGLEGYCPVTVVTRKKWWQGDSRYEAVHRGRTYLFAGATERRMFLAKPDRFSPALSGYDPVRYRKTGQLVDGKREHGVTYMDRMFLFADEASLQEFWQAPDGYLNESPPAMRPATAAPDPTPGTISADDRQASGDAPLGLDGYCPVTMLTLRQWRKGDSRYGVVHRRRTYLFVGEAQQKQFLADPDRFSLMFSGYDPVHFQETGQLVDGKREHGVTYNDRMVLFATKKSMTEFLSSPDAYMNQALPQ